MKTINEFFGMLQDVIAMASIVIHGTKQAAHMYDDVMTSARQQQLEELEKQAQLEATA